MDAREVLEEYKGVFINRGCLFVSTTGKLLSGYVNCEVIYPHYSIVRDLTEQLIFPFMDKYDVEGFICPAIGDIVLLQYAVILANLEGYQVTGVWADKHEEPDGTTSYIVERNGHPEAISGKRVVVLNDRISQGGTTLKVIAEARRLGCEVLGVSTLAGVSAATAAMLDVPEVNALCTIDVKAFPPDQIPEEFQGLPIAIDEPLGHGHEWPDKHPGYPGGFVRLLD